MEHQLVNFLKWWRMMYSLSTGVPKVTELKPKLLSTWRGSAWESNKYKEKRSWKDMGDEERSNSNEKFLTHWIQICCVTWRQKILFICILYKWCLQEFCDATAWHFSSLSQQTPVLVLIQFHLVPATVIYK